MPPRGNGVVRPVPTPGAVGASWCWGGRALRMHFLRNVLDGFRWARVLRGAARSANADLLRQLGRWLAFGAWMTSMSFRCVKRRPEHAGEDENLRVTEELIETTAPRGGVVGRFDHVSSYRLGGWRRL